MLAGKERDMIQKTAIIGMGALGMLYASQIIEGLGREAVEFVMDKARVEKYKNETFTVNGIEQDYTLIPVEEAKPVDLVILAVKYPALKAALDCMKNSVGEHTTILSVMNGVTSEKIIAKRYGDERVLYTVAQGMDAMKFGSKLRYTQKGELVLGIKNQEDEQKKRLKRVEEYFSRVGVPYAEDEHILKRMWGKFMLNVGVNQVCMVYQASYGQALEPGEANRMMIAAMREVRAVAELESVEVTEEDLNFYVNLLKTLDPDGMPSMAQDRINRKLSEVDMFAGNVIELADRYKIQVPANRYLYERVKEIEKEYSTCHFE